MIPRGGADVFNLDDAHISMEPDNFPLVGEPLDPKDFPEENGEGGAKQVLCLPKQLKSQSNERIKEMKSWEVKMGKSGENQGIVNDPMTFSYGNGVRVPSRSRR